MKIYIQKTGKNIELKFSGAVLKLLNQLKINPETVIVTSNDILVTEEEKINDSDKIEILQVVSGG
jgi:thiamine biosynthesis protein ThiS